MSSIAWLVPSLIEGSGGHRTIFQHIDLLAAQGHTSHVYVEAAAGCKTQKDIQSRIKDYFGGTSAKVHAGYEIEEDYDLMFATVWYSAKVVRDCPRAKRKAYFLQDLEALFNPMGDTYLFAENSYRYGLMPVTIGRWLTHKMEQDYGLASNYFELCANHTIYHSDPTVVKEHAVCFVYQPEKPRRAARLGLEALGILNHLRPDVNIYLFGSKASHHNIWFEHTNLGLLPLPELNRLYNRCKVGLCISSSNPSRIPFEMMASGLPVVELYRDNNLYDMPDGAILLADQTPESLAAAMMALLDDESRRQEMSQNALTYMKDRTLEYSDRQFLEAVQHMLADDYRSFELVQPMYTKSPFQSAIELGHLSAVRGIQARGVLGRMVQRTRAVLGLCQSR